MTVVSRPIDTGTNSYQKNYLKQDFDDFIDSLAWINEDIKGKSLYIMSKTISQSKLREAEFTITRSKDKADVIVIEDLRENQLDYLGVNYCYNRYTYGSVSMNEIEEYLDELDNDKSKSYKYIFTKDLYKYLYKYTGDFELFSSINDLFKSKSYDNQKIAMEFMSNANWSGNEIYLHELFNAWWNNGMRGNSYKNSISFKGFLNSLDFNYEGVFLSSANDYRELCKNEEHHEWVFKLFEQEFKNELDELVKRHKIKLDKIEFSIDKSIF